MKSTCYAFQILQFLIRHVIIIGQLTGKNYTKSSLVGLVLKGLVSFNLSGSGGVSGTEVTLVNPISGSWSLLALF